MNLAQALFTVNVSKLSTSFTTYKYVGSSTTIQQQQQQYKQLQTNTHTTNKQQCLIHIYIIYTYYILYIWLMVQYQLASWSDKNADQFFFVSLNQ